VIPGWPAILGLALLALPLVPPLHGADHAASQAAVKPITLRDALQTALLNNRALQIERINPTVARLTLNASSGYYDPIVTGQFRRENVSDSGAFDPANPAVDTGFRSESTIAGLGLTGFLPLGGLYNFSGDYGHSSGSRDFLNFDSYRANASVSLEQPLLKNSWIDSPRLTIRVNKKNLQISEDGVRFVAMDVLNQVQQGYHGLAAAWSAQRVQEDLLDTRTRFLRSVQRQIEVGKLTALDERIAQSQRAKVETELIAASHVVALAENNLKLLLGTSREDWPAQRLTPAEPLLAVGESFDLGTSWNYGRAQRPDLAQLTREVEKANLNVQFRRNQLFPALDVIGAYGRRGADAVQAFPPDRPSASASTAFRQIGRGDSPSDMIGLVFTMPLSRAAERANFRAGKELKKQAELLVRQKEELILREISDAIYSAQFGLERVASARRFREYATAALEAEEAKLAGGTSTLIFVLQFQADLAAARSAEIQAKLDYQNAVSQLHFAEGSILERNKMEIEFR
jgi:outer membrane protein TolC